MIDIKYVRENLSAVKKLYEKYGRPVDVDGLLKLDNARRQAQVQVDKFRADRNKAAQEKDKKAGTLIKEALKKAESALQKNEHDFYDVAQTIPNFPHESVPPATEGTKTLKTWGKARQFDFKVKDHAELGEALDIIDVERATKMSGSRFAILKNQAVDLEFALVQWVFDKLTAKGFKKILPPMLVREQAMWGTGFFPAEKSEVYKTDQDDLYLIGTAEVPLASYHTGEKIDVSKEPFKYAGFSSSFRREAGSYGKDSYGLIRVHQFDKVEMFVYADPQNSWREFDALIDISQEIFEELNLPYRQVAIHAGDLAAPNAKKIDFEIWLPSKNDYLELASCSNDTDFQARRLNVKTTDGEFVHTLNDTAVAIGRTIAAILENNQQKDGSVKMPTVLHKYLGFKEIK